MDPKPNRFALVCQRMFDRLLNPPRAVSAQLAALSRIKAFYGLNQTDISFRNQIEERQPEIRVVVSDLNDQSEVCFNHPSPSLLVALLNACGQLNLLLHSQ